MNTQLDETYNALMKASRETDGSRALFVVVVDDEDRGSISVQVTPYFLYLFPIR